MFDPIKLSRANPAVRRLLAITFPEYRGRTIRLVESAAVTFRDLNWSGGTRSEYRCLTVSDNGRATIAGADMNTPAPWNNPYADETVDLPADGLVVRHSIFCGHDAGITITIPPETTFGRALAGVAVKLLPA